MQLYDCKVRLGGSVLNEVRKEDVSAPEIIILREMHGSDAVVDVVKTRIDNRSDEDERARITAKYASPEKNNAESLKRKVEMMRALFGHEANPLPTKLAGDDKIPQADKPKRKKVEPIEAFA